MNKRNWPRTTILLLTLTLLACLAQAAACPLPALADGDGHSGTSTWNEADGNKIESVHLYWNTVDTKEDGNADFLWLSTRSTEALTMKFTVQVNLSGQAANPGEAAPEEIAGDYEPGDIRITLPRQIWHKRDVTGENETLAAGYGSMDVPITLNPTPTVDWYYEYDGDNIVIINNKRIGATSNHTFECAIYGIKPTDIVDESISDDLFAHVEAKTSLGNTIWMDSNILKAQIDTEERLTGVSKTGKFYEFIDDDDGVPASVLAYLPAGTSPSDYVYVCWTTSASVSGNQYLDLQMNDPETWCLERVLNHETNQEEEHRLFKGIFLAQTVKQGDNTIVKVGLGDGEQEGKGLIYNNGQSYKNDSVITYGYTTSGASLTLWAAYPNESFQNEHTYVFRNSDTWFLQEHDQEKDYWDGTDPKETYDKTAAGKAQFTKMTWDYPPGRFLAFKYIETDANHNHRHDNYDSAPNARGVSHDHTHTYEMALNKLREGVDITMDYELLTVGYGYMFTCGPLANWLGAEDIEGMLHESMIHPDYDDNWDSEEWIQDPEHFLNWYYVMDTSDRWDFFNYINRTDGDPQLTGEDYQFDGVYIQAPEMFSYARQKNSNYRFRSDSPFGYSPDSTLEKPTVELYVEYDNSAKIDRESGGGPEGWVKIGEYDVSSGSVWVPFDNTDGRIITGIRTRVTTKEAACKLTVYPRITLRASERVRSIVEQLFAESDAPSTVFRNDDNLYIELFKTAEDQSIYDPDTNPEGKVYPNQAMFLPEDVNFRQDIWDDSAKATFTGAGYGITLDKKVSFNQHSVDNGGDNDTVNKRAILHYSAYCTQTTNLSTQEKYDEAVAMEAVKQDTSCVWYDLLPENVVPMLNTVELTRANDRIVRVSTFDNYKGTGRTLMVVEAELTPNPEQEGSSYFRDKIGIQFNAYISWQELTALPENYELMNYIAYESGIEGQVGTFKGLQGEHDMINPQVRLNNSTPTGVPAKIAQALKDLDPNTDDGRFVYARVPITPKVLMEAHTEYAKYVMSDLEGLWTQGLEHQDQVNVYEGHTYTYRLRASSAKGTNTWNMIFYDTLENYLIPRPDPDDPHHDETKAGDYNDTRAKANWDGDWKEGTNGAPGGQWRGKLLQVDLKEFYALGCAPVLYYCTIPWMQFSDTYGERVDESVIFNDPEGHYMLDDPGTWTRVDMSTLSDGVWSVPDGVEVTAIAIDATRQPNGDRFVLPSKQYVTAYMHMLAPDDHGDESQWHAKGAYAHKTDAASTNEDIDWDAAVDPANNMHAFNNTRLISRQADESVAVSDDPVLTMIRNDYTRVGIMPTIKRVVKVWEDDDNHDNIRPDSITVEMLRKTQGVAGDYEPVIDEETGEPVTAVMTPKTVQVTDPDTGETTEEEEWSYIFYQVPVVDEAGNRYLYMFRDTVEGYTCSSSEDSTGRITLTNKHDNEKIPIKGEKQWLMPDGQGLSDEAKARLPEEITVKLYRAGASGEKELHKTLKVEPDGNGGWKYDFGEVEKYERGGFEYVYSIEEEDVPYFMSSLVAPEDRPAGYDIPFMDTDEFDPDTLELFYNFYMPYGDVAVQKEILNATGVAAETEFTFNVTLTKPGSDEALDGSYEYRVYTVAVDDATNEETLTYVRTGYVANDETITLKGGQRAVISKLPVGAGYKFTEDDLDGWNVPASASDPAGPKITNGSGKVKTGKMATARFTNTYAAQGYAQVRAYKKLTGRVLKASMYAFELVDMNPDSETYQQVIRSIGNQAPEDGQATQDADTGAIASEAGVRFGSIIYTEKDAGKDFHYQVRERDNGAGGVTYDPRTYDVTVHVEDNGDGTMTCTVSPSDPMEVVFENDYQSSGELVLRGYKVLQRRSAEDQEFTFELWESNANGEKVGSEPLQTVKNDVESNVIFDAIPFTQDDVSIDPENPFVYYYLVVEKDTGDPTITYTGYQHLFIVTPVDDGEGHVAFTSEEKGFNADGTEADTNVPVFINDVKNGALTIKKNVENGNAAAKFTFKVKLVGLGNAVINLERDSDDSNNGGEDDGSGTGTAEDISGIREVYYAPNDLINGTTAYAALNISTGEMQFFRTDPAHPTDPWGNAFDASGFTNNRQKSADGLFAWYSEVENGTHAWTSDDVAVRNAIKTVTMRDPIRPSTITFFFENCTNLQSVELNKMDLHDEYGSTRQSNWLYGTFSGTPNIKSINLGTLDLSKTYDIQYAFRNCTSLETLNIGHLHRVGRATSSYNYQNGAFTGTKITQITIGDDTTFSESIGSYAFDAYYPTALPGYEDIWVKVDDPTQRLTSLQLFTEGNHGGTWELDPAYFSVTFDADGAVGQMANRTNQNIHRDFVTGYNFYKFGYDFVGFRDNYDHDVFNVDASTGRVTIPSNTYLEKYHEAVENGTITAGEPLPVTLTAVWEEADSSANLQSDTLTVTLYGGESVTLKDIPAYTAYEVWEPRGNMPAGWVLKGKVNDSGEIQPLETAVTTFTNEYAPDKAVASMTASKLFDGVLTGGYKFELYNAEIGDDNSFQPVGEPIDTKETTDGGVASFKLIEYGPTDVGDHYYVIKEVIPDNPDPNVQYDEHLEPIIVNVSDDGKGNLKAVDGYQPVNGRINNGVFRNYTKPGSLSLTKKVEGATRLASEQTFSFRISFVDDHGAPAVMSLYGNTITSLSARITKEGSTSSRTMTCFLHDSVITISGLRADETITFAEVPAGVRYKIEEITQAAGWQITQQENATGTIVSNEESAATFTNAYSAKGRYSFSVPKIMPDEQPETGKYTFEAFFAGYYDLNNELVDPGDWDYDNNTLVSGAEPIETTNNSAPDTRQTRPLYTDAFLNSLSEEEREAAAAVTLPNYTYGVSLGNFSPINVTKEGTYWYLLREVPGDDPTVNYTQDTVFVMVYVRDVFGRGTLTNVVTNYYLMPSGSSTAPNPSALFAVYGYFNIDRGNQIIYSPEMADALIDTGDRDMAYYVWATNPQLWPMYGFMNTRKDGSLLISKDVEGSTEAGSSAVFTVKVKLTDKNGNLLSNREFPTLLDGVEGDPMETNASGVGTVTLLDGQTVEILALPHGATWELSETNLPGGFSLESIDNETGTIVGDQQSEAAVHNTYKASGKLELVAQKTMEPAEILTLDEGRFSFEIKDDRGTVVRSATNTADGLVEFPAIKYSMKDLDKTFVYTVSETLVDNLIDAGEESPYATDRTIYTVRVNITDNGDGTLATNEEIILNDEATDVALFTNTERTKVTVTKIWEGDETHLELRPKFVVVNLFADGDLMMTRAVNAERHATDDKNVWEYTFENLPKYKDGELIEYTVAEEPVDYYMPTIVKDGDYTIQITNTYSETFLTVSGTKVFVDKPTGESAEMKDGQFQVLLTSTQENAPMPEETVVDVAADGSFSFGDITFSLDDLDRSEEDNSYLPTATFTYQVQEVIPGEVDDNLILGETHVRYDDTLYDITVQLSYDEQSGKLNVEADVDTEQLTFRNEDRADLAFAVLTARKSLIGRDPQAGEFTFLLKQDDEVISSATNDETGLVTFEQLSFSPADLAEADAGEDGLITAVKTYTIEEVNDGKVGVNYDDHVETVTVTLTWQADGSITAEVDKTDENEPVFVNTLDTIDFQVTKRWNGVHGGIISLTIGTVEDDRFVALHPQPDIAYNDDVYTVTGLRKYNDEGEAIIYAAQEEPVPGYGLRRYDNDTREDRFALDGGVIVNTETMEIGIQKVWDGVPQGEETPEITLTLYRDGVATRRKPTKGRNGWYSFYNLEAGHTYYVVEEPLKGYTTVYKNGGSYADETEKAYNGGTITNVKVPKTGDDRPSPALWIALGAFSALGIAWLVLRRKRRAS